MRQWHIPAVDAARLNQLVVGPALHGMHRSRGGVGWLTAEVERAIWVVRRNEAADRRLMCLRRVICGHREPAAPLPHLEGRNRVADVPGAQFAQASHLPRLDPVVRDVAQHVADSLLFTPHVILLEELQQERRDRRPLGAQSNVVLALVRDTGDCRRGVVRHGLLQWVMELEGYI